MHPAHPGPRLAPPLPAVLPSIHLDTRMDVAAVSCGRRHVPARDRFELGSAVTDVTPGSAGQTYISTPGKMVTVSAGSARISVAFARRKNRGCQTCSRRFSVAPVYQDCLSSRDLPLVSFSPKVVFDPISHATALKPSSETSPSEPLYYLTRNCHLAAIWAGAFWSAMFASCQSRSISLLADL